ncbi:cytochrome c family protein, partial [bacterium]|nr:cytochrome c family protein [bacterium]
MAVVAGLWAAVALAAPPPRNHFEAPNTCARCHQTQFQEWQGSMKHYSAASPVFEVFELTTRKLTGRFGAHDAQNPTFCINCHSPIAAYQNEMLRLKKKQPFGEVMSPLAREGISCTMCHSVRNPDKTQVPEKGLLGDGIANASFEFFPFTQWVGPTTAAPLPQANEYHHEGFWPQKSSSEYLTSSQFCGACHNVHVPNSDDRVTGKPFQRIENLFTEWEEGPYNTPKNPYGKPVSCADCHMSKYGESDTSGRPFPPGTYS